MNFQKLEKLIFYTFIFSIPFQTRVVLRAWGVGFNEWNAAFLYGTDLLILAILGFWALRFVFGKARFNFSNYDWFLIGFITIFAISIQNASNQTLGFYQLLKLAEFSLLYFYVKSNLSAVFNMMTSFFVFFASGFFQAVLAILQYLRQADLGLRFLGETVLNPDLFNVAVFLVNGEKIMRPYGTTPHPNILALFLFISVFIYYFFYIKGDKFSHSKSGLLIYSVLLFSLFLTFSRVVIFVWMIGVGLRRLIFNRKFSRIAEGLSLKKITVATLTAIIIFSILFWPHILTRIKISSQEEAVSLRNYYNKVSLYDKLFFGVGSGNFVNWFREINPGLASNLYQPVHNIYLLIFSEAGILGLTAFLLFLIFLAKNYFKIKFEQPFYYSLFIIFLSLLFFGLFDHFLFTIQQGRIVFWLVLGLIASIINVPIAQPDRARPSGGRNSRSSRDRDAL